MSIGTDARLYRTGTSVTVSGVVRNQGAAAEPGLVLEVLRARPWGGALSIASIPMSLDPGAEQAYSASFEASQDEERLTASVRRGSGDTAAENNWSFRTGSPSLDVDLKLPDPRVRLVPTSSALVAATEADLDAQTQSADLMGSLPFPVTLPSAWGALNYDRFRQSPNGFVELVPQWSAGPTGTSAACLDSFDPWAMVLAGGVGELDLSGSGFVGYKVYAAGSQDRGGRVFPADTLVFVWEGPGASDPALRRSQVLLSSDGLVRFDAESLPAESGCAKTGLAMPYAEGFGSSAPAPFGLRAETGVGRSPFTGRIQLKNAGSYPGSVDLDYGRVGGSRTTTSLSLAPGQSQSLVFEDAISADTAYSLVTSGDLSGTWEQQAVLSEGLRVEYTGEPTLTPGSVALPLRVVKTGGVGGPVTVSFGLATSSGTSTVTRTYDLEPGFWSQDALTFDVPEGAVTLTAASDVPLAVPVISLLAGPQERLAMTVTAGPTVGGRFPIGIDLVNSGLAAFQGEVRIEGATTAPAPVILTAGQTGHLDLPVDLAGQTPGPHTYVVRLASEAGVVLSQHTIEREVRPAHVTLVSSPAGAAFNAGTLAALHFRLSNGGDQPATGLFRFEVFDEPREASFSLDPGAETDIVFELPLDPDLEQRVYAGRFVIESDRAVAVTGQVNFTVNGIALTVDASLDRDGYAEGDTAHFTVNVTNGRPGLGTAYLVRVHYADFDETRPASIESSTSLVFDIPLPQLTGEALFLGITHPDGRSLYINTYHLRRSDALAQIALNQQVYAPGAAVVVTAASAATGTLTLSAPGYSETVPLSGSTSRSFSLASDLPGGTYFVSWSFSASDGRSASGSVPFDVSGLRVRVFEARLAKGRYESGEAIESTLRIHTNQPTSVVLRAFVLDPEGLNNLVGETGVSLTPDEDLLATHSWPFSSAIAGLHRLVYGLYQGGDTLLASGSLAFDVGSAAVLGVRTDKTEYPIPNEPVNVSVSAFVSGPASLRIEVNGATVATREVTVPGIVEVPLTLDPLSAGPHTLTAVMEAGGYSSRRSTSFALGTSLPDLVAGTTLARRMSGASWKLDASVSNAGRSSAPATTLILRNPATGASIGAAEVPSLAPGASATVSLDWNVLGAAGSREVEAVADATAAVAEFREDNNTSLTTIDIPAIVVDAVAQPTYPANVEAGLGASVLNLTSDTTFAGLSVSASVTRPDGSAVPLPGATLGPLAPAAEVFLGTPWAVGRSAPGTYALSSQVLDSAGASQGTSTTYFQVLSTPAFSGTVTGTPNPVASGAALSLAGHVTNQGNVAAEGTARFEVLDSGNAVVAQAETPGSVPLNGSTDVSASIARLEVPPGDYHLDLRMVLADQAHPVAATPLAVTGESLEAAIGSDLTPRVLVYVGGAPWDAAGRARRTAFVQASLAGSGAFVNTTSDPLEFARLFRSGTWNTHVVMTDVPLLLPLLADELREAAFRGDGLLLVQWRIGSTPALEPALGAHVQGQLSGSSHTLSLLAGPLGPAESIVVPNQAAKLTLSGAVLAGTMDGSQPVLAVNGFGAGRSVAMAFDPGVSAQDPASASLRGLFARAVAYAAPRQPRSAAPGTVLPLAVSLHNSASTDQEVEVTLTLPFGVTLASADDSPLTQEPPTWRVTVAAGATRLLRFQVVVPDAVGTFVITSVVEVGGVAISNPPSFTLEVPRTTDQTLADVIASLETTPVSPADQDHLQAAVSLLHLAQWSGTDLLGLEARIRLAVGAAARLGQIRSADVSSTRRSVDQLVAAWERASFEQISVIGSSPAADPRRSASIATGGWPPPRLPAWSPQPHRGVAEVGNR